MASKSKRAVALTLTAMLAAASLAGCGGTESGTSSTGSTDDASTSSASSDSSSSDTSTDVSTVDIYSDEVLSQIKDAIAEEAVDGVVTLKVWCASSDGTFEKSRIEAFEEVFADSRYEFKITTLANVGESDAGTKILEDPSVGADVFSFADDQLSDLVNANAIAQVASLFVNNLTANNTAESVEVCTVNDNVYAFPKTSDNGFFLYYDKRIFSEDDIATFDDLIATAAENDTNVLMALDNAWYNTGFFLTAGCEISLVDNVQNASFVSDEGLSAMKAMCHICENIGNGFKGSGDDTVVIAGFQDGTISAAVTGTWNGSAIKDAIGEENVGAAKLPTILIDGEQKQLCSFGGYKLLGVNAYSECPTAAQALAYYLTDEESQALRYSGDENSRGLIPTNSAVLASDALSSDEAVAAVDAQREYSYPQSIVGGKYWTPVGSIGGDVVTAKGNLTDDEIMEKLEACVASFE